ncbi:MAG: TldD/PmbA family protein [Bdellovibrionales bacterium]|nr:TldD/PmbA family protein [Bdellovibrionales bacterium]
MDALKESFNKIAAEAKGEGAKVELLLSRGENLNLGYSQRKLEKFESTQTQMAGLRVILGASQGYAYTENLSWEALHRTYKEALSNAKTLKSDEKNEVLLMKPQSFKTIDGLFSTEEIPMNKKMEVAKLLEEVALNQDPRIQAVPYSSFSEGMGSRRVLNSEGMDQEYKTSYFTGYAYPLAKDGENSKMDGDSFFVRSFKDVRPEETAKEGARKALSRLGAQKLKTGNYAVVISREMFPMVMEMFTSYLSAKEVYEEKSLFKGKLNQKIASEKFQVVDDPFETRGPSMRPFDSEGAPSQKTVIFENGVLKSYLTNLEYSQKMKLPHTAHAARSPASSMDIGPTNLVVSKGTKTLQQLLEKYDQVVYLTEFSAGLHSGYKETTGDISMPAEGFLYEKGKMVGPIDQFVVSGNIMDVLSDIDELGNEYAKPGSSYICPDVLIKSMSFAGA